MNFGKTVFTIVILHLSFFMCSQKELHVNGKKIDNNRCVEIRLTNENLETSKEVQSDIIDATITDDCIELRIQYGGCGGNIEFVTDAKIVNSPKAKMNFKLNWVEPSTCKETKEILVTFDLSLFKRIIQENKAVISILGTDIQLKYKN